MTHAPTSSAPSAPPPAPAIPMHLSGTFKPRHPRCIAYVEDIHSAWRVWHDRRDEMAAAIKWLMPHLSDDTISSMLTHAELLGTCSDDNFEYVMRAVRGGDE